MSAQPSDPMRPQRRPAAVVAAACLLLASALLRAVPYEALLSWSSYSEVRWYFLPSHLGGWMVTPLLALLALFLLRGCAWAPYAVGALVAGLLLVESSPAFGAQLHNFPLAVARDVASGALQLAAVALLFLPSSRRWFHSA
jgi:hypothetical protein